MSLQALITESAIQAVAPEKPSPFALGVDLSVLQVIEDHGVVYRMDGHAMDPLLIFKSHGCNTVRLRLFVAPDGRQGQVNTPAYTLRLAKRVKDAGLRLLLDFHYSDHWADPLHQTIPAEWAGLSHPQLMERVYAYTRDTMDAFRDQGCFPDMVEIGNEITNGFLWPVAGPFTNPISWNKTPAPALHAGSRWEALTDLLKAGIRAVRQSDKSGSVQVMIHIDKGGSCAVSQWFFEHLEQWNVAFDVIGLSFYPFWHGTLSDLKENLVFLSQTYHKDVIVVETGYNFREGDQHGMPFAATPDGQKAYLEALLQVIAETPGGRGAGMFYWAPEWIQGERWGGPDWSQTWENRALFDCEGNALPALDAFDSVRELARP